MKEFLLNQNMFVHVHFCIPLGAYSVDDLTSDKVIVKMEDFTRASNKFIPSISKKDLEYFNQLKDTYNNV